MSRTRPASRLESSRDTPVCRYGGWWRCRASRAAYAVLLAALLPVPGSSSHAVRAEDDGVANASSAPAVTAPSPLPVAVGVLGPATGPPVSHPYAAWFAYRDPESGELVVPPPQELERATDARLLTLARSRWVPVERRLPNGAVEIELPIGHASPLFGWLDENGELRTGHRVPTGLLEQAGDDRTGSGER